jgi:flagellin
MYVNHNVYALDAQRNLEAAGMSLSKSVERLSSGLRINRAADDAAGLSISEKLRSQTRGLDQAQRNAQDGISMIQTAEGAMNEVHDMLQRMRELSLQSANDTLTGNDRGAINTELQQLKTEVDSVRDRTKFNGQALLTGSLATTQSGGTLVNGPLAGVGGGGNTSSLAVSNVDVSNAKAGQSFAVSVSGNDVTVTMGSGNGAVSQTITSTTANAGSQNFSFDKLGIKFTMTAANTAGTGATQGQIAAGLNGLTLTTAAGSASANFQVGAQSTDTMNVAFSAVDINALGISTALSDFNTQYNTTTAVTASHSLTDALDTAIQTLSTTRANLGASQNRLEHAINNIAVSSENTTAAESRIRDTDMAKEMANFSRNQILNQAGTAILAQANQVPQGVLSLLR